MKVKISRVIFLSFISLLLFFCSYSHDSIPAERNNLKKNFLENDGRWNIAIPLWVPGFRGEYAYGDVVLEGEDGSVPEPGNPIEKPSPGDIFKRLFKSSGSLQFFFMNQVSYTKNNFYAHFDAFSGTVGGSLKFRYNNSELVNAKFNTNLLRFYAGYKLVDSWSQSGKFNYRLYPYAGIRVHNVNVTSTVNKTNVNLEVNPLWSEPIFGFTNNFTFQKWKFLVSADVGNFNINQKFSYMINLSANYRISNLLSLKVGWVDWDIKYKDQILKEELTLNIHLSGPAVAISFHL